MTACELCHGRGTKLTCERESKEGREQHVKVTEMLRAAEHREWSLLAFRPREDRWHLDGRPIHCGDGIELQSRRYKIIGGDEFTFPIQDGVAGRFELAWTKQGKLPEFYTSVGGHTFHRAIEHEWMRFRWPEVRS